MPSKNLKKKKSDKSVNNISNKQADSIFHRMENSHRYNSAVRSVIAGNMKKVYGTDDADELFDKVGEDKFNGAIKKLIKMMTPKDVDKLHSEETRKQYGY
jgi:hypothetical protein